MNKIPLLFVSVDALGRKMTSDANTPFLDFIKESGNNMEEASSCFPTLTTPMMSTILTGCLPYRHGINCNSRFDRDDKEIKGKLRDLKVKTISEYLREEDYRSLSVQHFMLEGRVDEYHQIDGSKSELNTDTIIESLKHGKFDSVFTIYQAVDHFGHKTGPLSKKTVSEIEKVDNELERLITFLKKYWGDFLFVLTSDHSMSLADRHSDFNLIESLNGLGLNARICNVGDKVSDELDCVILKYPTVSILFNTDKARKQNDNILELLGNEKDIEKIYNKYDMKELGNENYADISFFMKRGYTDVPQAILDVNNFGYHGTENELDSTICFWGHGVEYTENEKANLTDVVPTCLDYLDIGYDEGNFDGKTKRR